MEGELRKLEHGRVKVNSEEILELRAMELKHGRVAMLAVLGWFHVAAGYHIVGDYAVGEHLVP